MGITEFESVSPTPKVGILARLEDIPKAAIQSCIGIPALQVRCINCYTITALFYV